MTQKRPSDPIAILSVAKCIANAPNEKGVQIRTHTILKFQANLSPPSSPSRNTDESIHWSRNFSTPLGYSYWIELAQPLRTIFQKPTERRIDSFSILQHENTKFWLDLKLRGNFPCAIRVFPRKWILEPVSWFSSVLVDPCRRSRGETERRGGTRERARGKCSSRVTINARRHCCQPFYWTAMKSNLLAIYTGIKVTKDVRICIKNIYQIVIASCNCISFLVSFVFHIAGHCH